MKKGTHGFFEETFDELTYVGQARSINAQISVLEKAIKVHFKKGLIEGKDVGISKIKYLSRITRLLSTLSRL